MFTMRQPRLTCASASYLSRLPKQPGPVIIQHLHSRFAANEIERRAKHIRMADIVDHHVIVAWNGYDRADGLHNVRRLQSIKVMKSAIDADGANIDASREQ